MKNRQKTPFETPGQPTRRSLPGALRRFALLTAFALVSLIAAGVAYDTVQKADAQDLRFFRIGTGSTSGTYFPIGGIIASAISNPPGSRECERGGSCGVPGLIAVVQSTNASVANVQGIMEGTLDSGFAQADIAYWAHHGTGIFKDSGAMSELRAISNLYPESIHLVVRVDAGIREVTDLKGKRISIDRDGSGTQVDAKLILEAYGLSVDDLQAEHVALGAAADMMIAGELDGFFMVAGTPANAIKELAREVAITLVPIDGPEAEKLMEDYPFLNSDIILSGVYQNVPATQTLSVGAQWVTSTRMSEDTIYRITQALWHANTRRLLDGGHPKGRLITLETALDGIGIPLHAGARRYYREVGLLTVDEEGNNMDEATDGAAESGAAASD